MIKYDELLKQYKKLEKENRILREEIKQLKMQFGAESKTEFMYINEDVAKTNHQAPSVYNINQGSTSNEKLSLYLSLFRGRSDVCAKKWKNKPGYSPYCYNDFKPGVCHKPKIKCSKCSNSDFAQLNHEQLRKHLLGEHVLGLFPMTTKDTCYLLAMDFDEATWKDDIAEIRSLCYANNIPVYAERSRSGEGCHLWFFFEKEIKASVARKFGMAILDLAMQESASIRFDSYDRLFPSQDFLQKEGFGSLIALPLQKEARLKNNSVFIDDDLEEINDQWQYLSQVVKIPEKFVVEFIKSNNTVTVFSEPDREDDKERVININKSDFPELLVLKKEKGIEISKQGISPKGLHFLRKISSYSNPEFYAKQAMRQSTFGTPRVTVMYRENEKYIVLPRGIEFSLTSFLDLSDIRYSIIDRRFVGRTIDVKFSGLLNQDQETAFAELNNYAEGVLSATTGFGKTVIGARIIAEKSVPTLILVHTKELAAQWKDRLEQFLEINESVETKKRRKKSVVGQLGGGKKTLNGIVDIAMMQSMFEKDRDVKSLINQYGLIIVDECHHVSAANFSRILGAADSKYVYGLTATPVRKDGHHPIIFMHCGPVRYKVDAKEEAKRRGFDHFIVPRFTSARMPAFKKNDDWHITEVYQHICESSYRNELIVTDIEQAINSGRSPLVLTERTSHIELLVEMMRDKDYEVIVLSGDLKPKIRKAALERIRSLNDGDRFVIVATGKLIGEGFDEARLDTLFMALPIAWKGTIAQYAGRLHRNYEGKEEVLIYDYVDVHIPVLERMYHKRLTAYRSVGYSIKAYTEGIDSESVIYNESDYFEHVISDIKNARKNVLVSSPFLQKKKIDSIKELLVEKYNSGVRITLCIKKVEDYSDRQKAYISKFISGMVEQGIDVIQVAQNRYKFMIIDNEIVWYGGIDIFGGNFNESSLIRIQNEGLANELLGTILEFS